MCNINNINMCCYYHFDNFFVVVVVANVDANPADETE